MSIRTSHGWRTWFTNSRCSRPKPSFKMLYEGSSMWALTWVMSWWRDDRSGVNWLYLFEFVSMMNYFGSLSWGSSASSGILSNKKRILWTAYSGSYSGLPLTWNSISFYRKILRISSKTCSSSVDSSMERVTMMAAWEFSLSLLIVSCRNSNGFVFEVSGPYVDNMISEKYERNSGLRLALVSSWFRRVILTDSVLSLEALLASLSSIYSISSFSRYLSKSLPKLSESCNKKIG